MKVNILVMKNIMNMHLPCADLELFRDMCKELEAAREIVSYHRASLCANGMAYLTCTCYGCHLLRKYDEAIR